MLPYLANKLRYHRYVLLLVLLPKIIILFTVTLFIRAAASSTAKCLSNNQHLNKKMSRIDLMPIFLKY